MRMPALWRNAQKPNSIRSCGHVCVKRVKANFWGAQAASLFISAACRDACASWWFASAKKCRRQAAGNCRLAACAPQSPRTRMQLFAGAELQHSSRVFAIQFGDETGTDLSGAHSFAFVSVSAISETFSVHHLHHFQDATLSFGMSLR